MSKKVKEIEVETAVEVETEEAPVKESAKLSSIGITKKNKEESKHNKKIAKASRKKNQKIKSKKRKFSKRPNKKGRKK
jgi:hypothetical protein